MRPPFALLAALLLAAAPARAQVDAPSRVTLTWENDLLAGTDRHYTNGLRLDLVGRLDPQILPSWLAGDEVEWGLALGQRIYTPERLDEPGLVADDRPYAGWSYLGLSVSRRVAALEWEDRLELTLGVVGPASGARATHELAHEVFGSDPPRGWRHQLHDEPGVTLAYRASTGLLRGDAGSVGWDLAPGFGVSLGNVATFASIGLGLRCGLGVPDDFGVLVSSGAPRLLRIYLTAAIEARLVGYDIFLDGNLLRNGGHRVHKECLVADLSLGLVVAVHGRLSLTYTHTLQTSQFDAQVGADQFGSISVAVSW